MREDVGSFDEPCPDPMQASSPDERLVCMEELPGKLSSTPWVGTGTSGVFSTPLLVEFGPDGSYKITNKGRDSEAFVAMFPTRDESFGGTYTITDLFTGEFFGLTEQTLLGTVNVPGELKYLVLHGDALVFSLRFQTFVDYPTATRLVLRPQR